MLVLSLPYLTAKLSVVDKITCFSSLYEVSTGPVALYSLKQITVLRSNSEIYGLLSKLEKNSNICALLKNC